MLLGSMPNALRMLELMSAVRPKSISPALAMSSIPGMAARMASGLKPAMAKKPCPCAASVALNMVVAPSALACWRSMASSLLSLSRRDRACTLLIAVSNSTPGARSLAMPLPALCPAAMAAAPPAPTMPAWAMAWLRWLLNLSIRCWDLAACSSLRRCASICALVAAMLALSRACAWVMLVMPAWFSCWRSSNTLVFCLL